MSAVPDIPKRLVVRDRSLVVPNVSSGTDRSAQSALGVLRQPDRRVLPVRRDFQSLNSREHRSRREPGSSDLPSLVGWPEVLHPVQHRLAFRHAHPQRFQGQFRPFHFHDATAVKYIETRNEGYYVAGTRVELDVVTYAFRRGSWRDHVYLGTSSGD